MFKFHSFYYWLTSSIQIGRSILIRLSRPSKPRKREWWIDYPPQGNTHPKTRMFVSNTETSKSESNETSLTTDWTADSNSSNWLKSCAKRHTENSVTHAHNDRSYKQAIQRIDHGQGEIAQRIINRSATRFVRTRATFAAERHQLVVRIGIILSIGIKFRCALTR